MKSMKFLKIALAVIVISAILTFAGLGVYRTFFTSSSAQIDEHCENKDILNGEFNFLFVISYEGEFVDSFTKEFEITNNRGSFLIEGVELYGEKHDILFEVFVLDEMRLLLYYGGNIRILYYRSSHSDFYHATINRGISTRYEIWFY